MAGRAGGPLVAVLGALDYAARKHVNHRRKGEAAEPYVNHLIEVAALLAAATSGRDEALVTAGVLHDVIEDAGVEVGELRRRFGPDVATLVAEVTDDKTLSWQARKDRQVETAHAKSRRARMLKLADKTSNLRSLALSPPVDWSSERRERYVDWAKQVANRCKGVNARLDRAFEVACAEAQARLAPMSRGRGRSA